MSQAFAPSMVKQEEGGSIVNICSIYGCAGPDQRLYDKQNSKKPVHYSVTKAGIHGFTKYLAAYYAESKLRVNTLTPGGVFNGHSEVFEKDYSQRAIMGRMA